MHAPDFLKILAPFIAHKVVSEKPLKKGRKETYFPLQPEKAIKRQILTVPGSQFVEWVKGLAIIDLQYAISKKGPGNIFF